MSATLKTRLIGACAAATLAAFVGVGAARADEPSQLDQLQDNVKVGAAADKGLSFLVVPLPVINPAAGNGLALVGGVFYSPVQGGRQWLTGAGGLYTSNKDWAFGLAQQADLFNGKLRLTAFAGLGDANLDFFGIGQSAGSTGRSIKLNEKGKIALFSGLYEVAPSLFVGIRYRFLGVDSSLAQPLFPNHPILPTAEFDTRISGLGPSVQYDTRDQEFRPRHGLFITGQWLFNGSALGSSFDYNKLNAAANWYHSLDTKTVVAVRGSICDTSQGAPFYDLCFFGSSNDLRGYEGGQYRDHAMYAVQAEIRRDLFWRFGVVAFGGVGSVASSFGELLSAPQLPAGGVGLRFQPSKKLPINIAMDYAWGKDSQGLYLSVGEAF